MKGLCKNSFLLTERSEKRIFDYIEKVKSEIASVLQWEFIEATHPKQWKWHGQALSIKMP